MEKKPLLVPGVTTFAGFVNCLKSGTAAFAVENPLYTRSHRLLRILPLPRYRKLFHDEKQVALLVKRSGKNAFDESRQELVYPPLRWDGWVS